MPSNPKKFIDIRVDREWTETVVSHVRTCGRPLEYVESEQAGFVMIDHYTCPACRQTLTKESSARSQDLRDMVRQSILKKAALGIPLENIHQQVIVRNASDEEIAATLEEPPLSTTVEIEPDKEWTRTVAHHVIQCRSDVVFQSADQNLFELVDHYQCLACNERLSKRASRDRPGVVGDGPLKVELNHNIAETLAMDPPPMTSLQLYRFYRMSDTVCPTLEEINELVGAYKQTSAHG